MKQKSEKTSRNYPSHLKIVKGYQEQATEIGQLVNTAWSLTYTALWNASVFSPKEIENAKGIIRQYLAGSNNPHKAYLAFCQRILVAKLQTRNKSTGLMQLPTHWLNIERTDGFVSTKGWFDAICSIRSSLPAYRIELKGFAEAILEISEDPSRKNFHYWRNYFIDRRSPVLLNLFLETIANQQYGV